MMSQPKPVGCEAHPIPQITCRACGDVMAKRLRAIRGRADVTCEECGTPVDLDGDGLTVGDYAGDQHYCSSLCVIHNLSSGIWNALLDATAGKGGRS